MSLEDLVQVGREVIEYEIKRNVVSRAFFYQTRRSAERRNLIENLLGNHGIRFNVDEVTKYLLNDHNLPYTPDNKHFRWEMLRRLEDVLNDAGPFTTDSQINPYVCNVFKEF